jgi:hypothetical protein
MRNLIVASVLGLALVATGVAYAGDEAPAKPAAETKTAPVTTAEKATTATPSPIHSMMKWVSSHVMEGEGCGCPSTAEGEKAWRAWFKSDSPKLATLRTALMADGWDADKTVGYFKQMAAAKAGGCENCENCDKSECGCKGGCDKAKGAAAATGDAGTTGDKAGGCCGSCKGGCDKAKGAAAATGDAGTTGDKAGGCCGSCKGGCDKAKAKGAAAATGDAGTTGDAPAKCPCTGKDIKDCEGGCGNDGCPCGKSEKSDKSDKSDK